MSNTFHIRNKTTGLFYKGLTPTYDRDKMDYTSVTVDWAPKGFGKTFKDMGKLKTHLMVITGITQPPQEIKDLEAEERELHSQIWGIRGGNITGFINYATAQNYATSLLAKIKPEADRIRQQIEEFHLIHPGYRNQPEWLWCPYALTEIPADWELVEVSDKRNKIWTTVDFDMNAYAQENLRLRKLTDNYGSAVRDVYKKLEKSGKKNDFPFVIAVRLSLSNADKQSKSSWYEDIQLDKEPVNAAIERIGIKAREMLRSSKRESVALAVKEEAVAFWLQLAYEGQDDITVIDMRVLDKAAKPANITAPGIK